jgi:hypothetical protein
MPPAIRNPPPTTRDHDLGVARCAPRSRSRLAQHDDAWPDRVRMHDHGIGAARCSCPMIMACGTPSRRGHGRADATRASREQSRQPPWPGDGCTRRHAAAAVPVRGDTNCGPVAISQVGDRRHLRRRAATTRTASALDTAQHRAGHLHHQHELRVPAVQGRLSPSPGSRDAVAARTANSPCRRKSLLPGHATSRRPATPRRRRLRQRDRREGLAYHRPRGGETRCSASDRRRRPVSRRSRWPPGWAAR